MAGLEGHHLAAAFMHVVMLIQLTLVGCFDPEAAHGQVNLPMESRLVADMRERASIYGKDVLPVTSYDVPLNVSFGIRVLKINVDTKLSQVSVAVWCRLLWYDANLKWNASAYEGITRVYIPSSSIWTPDITLINSAKLEQMSHENTKVSLAADGRIFMAFHQVFQVPCLITLENYPWDEYSCDMWFQSPGYSYKRLNPVLYRLGSSTPFDLETYLGGFREMDEWEVVRNATAEVNRPSDEGVILMYSKRKALRMTLTLRRRTGFIALLLTVPCVIFSLMSCLVFCIPPTRPDRLAFGNSLFAAFMVFLLILAASVPPTSGAFPRLGIFYGFNSLLIISAIFLSVVNINLTMKGLTGARLSVCAQKVVLQTLGPLLLVPPVGRKASPNSESCNICCKKGSDPGSPTRAIKADTDHEPTYAVHQKGGPKEQSINNAERGIPVSGNEKEHHEKLWKNLVLVLDRLLFIVYLFAIVFGLAFLFPWPQRAE